MLKVSYRPFQHVDNDWGKMSESLGIDSMTVALVRLEGYIRLAAKFSVGFAYDSYKHLIPTWYVICLVLLIVICIGCFWRC